MTNTNNICGKDWPTVCERAAAYANRHGQSLERAQEFLRRAGWGDSTFGIESGNEANTDFEYLNSGDTYETTVVRIDGGACAVGCWGDIVESAEIEYCESESVIRCANCGAYTPNNCEQWRDVVCESCGHHVDGSSPQK